VLPPRVRWDYDRVKSGRMTPPLETRGGDMDHGGVVGDGEEVGHVSGRAAAPAANHGDRPGAAGEPVAHHREVGRGAGGHRPYGPARHRLSPISTACSDRVRPGA